MMAALYRLLSFLVLAVLLTGSFCDASEEVGIYEIKRGSFSVKITNYGATVISVILPDKNGLFLFMDFLL